jgi:hypothetical protein
MSKKIRIIGTLAEMAEGFPIAHRVFAVAVATFTLFHLGSMLASTTPAYQVWLEASEPFTEAAATVIPAVTSAGDFLQMHRNFLEEHGTLYWIPAVRNVLSIDFALLLFFPSCFIVALCIDLLWDRQRALKHTDQVVRRLGYPIGRAILWLAAFSLFFLLSFCFDLFGMARPFLLGLATSLVAYYIVIGISGMFLFSAIYLAVCFVAMKTKAYVQGCTEAALDSKKGKVTEGSNSGEWG